LGAEGLPSLEGFKGLSGGGVAREGSGGGGGGAGLGLAIGRCGLHSYKKTRNKHAEYWQLKNHLNTNSNTLITQLDST
jgi:hypothetical protein